MKQIVTVIVCEKLESEVNSPVSGLDIMYTDESRSCAEIIHGGVKQSKSRYTVLVDSDFSLSDVQPFLDAADSSNADILTFDGGYCFKTAVLKGLDIENCGDRYSAEIFAALSSKSISKLEMQPFEFKGTHTPYSEEAQARLVKCLDVFRLSKSKLPKDVYSFAFEIILSRLVTFYITAILAVRSGEITVDRLTEFDSKLKENIVLYLALEKRFTYANLKKLRESYFKISFITANKFKKLLK